MVTKQYTFIDLFAGCGGLSEGFLSTGRYRSLAHVEWEKPMVETLRRRLVQKWGFSVEEAERNVVLFDIQKTEELLNGHWQNDSLEKYGAENALIVQEHGLRGLVGEQRVNLIIGGPPCQAYSIHGRATDKNSMQDDYRNFLFESFCMVVNGAGKHHQADFINSRDCLKGIFCNISAVPFKITTLFVSLRKRRVVISSQKQAVKSFILCQVD